MFKIHKLFSIGEVIYERILYIIIDILSRDNWQVGISLLTIVSTIIIAYITAKTTAKNAKNNLTTQYFKEKGVETQEKILQFWCGLFVNNFDIQTSYNLLQENKKNYLFDDVEIIKNITKDSYIYSSSQTIRAIRMYTQYVYYHKDKSKNPISNLIYLVKNKLKNTQLLLIARIIVKMKYDFTGERVDVLDIIKIKVDDLKLLSRFLFRVEALYYWTKERFVSIILFLLAIILIGDKIF